jgi:two-component system, chemotaxis family, protein-glutamate methylesterase/glutaminase
LKKIGVLIVDDSSLVRLLLSEVVRSSGEMFVVGAAASGLAALELCRRLRPDIVTVDLEMPGMNGIEFVETLMREQPTPILVIAGTTRNGAQQALRALNAGAVDYVAKPLHNQDRNFERYRIEILEKLAAAARVKSVRTDPTENDRLVPSRKVSLDNSNSTSSLIVIGASTGGPNAITTLLSDLPSNCPPIVVAIHMPAMFTAMFAARLNDRSNLTVKEASDAERLCSGTAYIIPGGFHGSVKMEQGRLEMKLTRSAIEYSGVYTPSVDQLFSSAANCRVTSLLAVVLSGMGDDGTTGAGDVVESGGTVIAQDEASCVVYGMPKSAIAAGYVAQILPLKSISAAIVKSLSPDPSFAQEQTLAKTQALTLRDQA